jgi:hypothetical protein
MPGLLAMVGAALVRDDRTLHVGMHVASEEVGLASRTQAALYPVEHKLVEPPKA